MSYSNLTFILLLCLWFPILGQEQQTTPPDTNQTPKSASTTQKKLEALISKITKQVKQQADSSAPKTDNIEIDGLIIDQTLTKLGHEFYEYYYALWEAPPGIKNYTIFINEKNLISSSSLIQIKVNDMLIFQQLLKPRSEEIEAAAKSGIEITLRFLYQYKQDQKQLEGDDLSGSGIY